ncbi:InlB B-repeat-containing protein [Gemmiger formicilis]|uniref:InlB B-repeat-containing protein n=1 Tax=Gemmiger formicilis TaxID=745368 RepID=UPI0019596ABE|nr:InlB B-repeat-containing protein [Gemmiger formicilis]
MGRPPWASSSVSSGAVVGSGVAVGSGVGVAVELWPYTPSRAGYLFMGWYADEALTQPVGTIVLVKDTTIYAKWVVDPAAAAASQGGRCGNKPTKKTPPGGGVFCFYGARPVRTGAAGCLP